VHRRHVPPRPTLPLSLPPSQPALLSYTFEVCQTLASNRGVRMKVLRILVKAHREQAVSALVPCMSTPMFQEGAHDVHASISAGVRRASMRRQFSVYQ
jgi:hypothetical protein